MKPQDNTQAITYVKLPQYTIPFMHKQHGNPMVFGAISPYQVCLVNHLVSNPNLDRYYSDVSFSEYSYKLAQTSISGQLSLFSSPSIPDVSELPSLAPVVIPKNVIAYDSEGHLQAVCTNQHYQLTRLGAQLFRKYVKNEFWTALNVWFNTAHKELGKSYPGIDVSGLNRKDLLLEFMTHYNIPIEHFETIYRNYQREIVKV